MIRIYHLDPDKDWGGGARNGAKVMIALRDLGLAHEVVYVDRTHDMRNPQSEFRKRVNSWGTVPVIDHDGFILKESAAILRYLADLCPGNDLFPAQPRQKAYVDQWLTWGCAMLVPSLLNFVRLGRYDGVPNTDPVARAQELYAEKFRTMPEIRDAVERWNFNLELLNQQLAGREYVADRYSLADIALGCVAPIGTVFGATLVPFEHICAWLERLGERANWRAERTFVLDVNGGRKAGLIPCSDAVRARIEPRRWAQA
jgi:glutathione S-transferase